MQPNPSENTGSPDRDTVPRDRMHRERSILWPVLLASWVVSFSIAWTHETVELQDSSPIFGITDPETQSFLEPFRKAAMEWEKDVEKLSATVGISRGGVEFSSLDGEDVYILFLVVSPPDRPGDHLRGLQNISQHLRSPDFCNFLKQSTTSADIWDLLVERDEGERDA